MEKPPETDLTMHGPKTQSEVLGKLDALITQIDLQIIALGENTNRGFDHRKLEELTRQKNELMSERAHATGSKIDRNFSETNLGNQTSS